MAIQPTYTDLQAEISEFKLGKEEIKRNQQTQMVFNKLFLRMTLKGMSLSEMLDGFLQHILTIRLTTQH